MDMQGSNRRLRSLIEAESLLLLQKFHVKRSDGG